MTSDQTEWMLGRVVGVNMMDEKILVFRDEYDNDKSDPFNYNWVSINFRYRNYIKNPAFAHAVNLDD